MGSFLRTQRGLAPKSDCGRCDPNLPKKIGSRTPPKSRKTFREILPLGKPRTGRADLLYKPSDLYKGAACSRLQPQLA